MKQLSESEISQLATDIKNCLKRWGLEGDVSLLYNGIREVSELEDDIWVWKESIGYPSDYCDYVAEDHVLTMLFEGPLYDLFNAWDIPIETENIGKEALEYADRELGLRQELEQLKNGYGYIVEIDPTEFGSHEEYLIAKYEKEDEVDREAEAELMPLLLEENKWKITELAIKDFNTIFDRYGIWYNFGDRWNLTCSYKNEKERISIWHERENAKDIKQEACQ